MSTSVILLFVLCVTIVIGSDDLTRDLGKELGEAADVSEGFDKRGKVWSYVGDQHSSADGQKRGKTWQYVGDQHKAAWKKRAEQDKQLRNDQHLRENLDNNDREIIDNWMKDLDKRGKTWQYVGDQHKAAWKKRDFEAEQENQLRNDQHLRESLDVREAVDNWMKDLEKRGKTWQYVGDQHKDAWKKRDFAAEQARKRQDTRTEDRLDERKVLENEAELDKRGKVWTYVGNQHSSADWRKRDSKRELLEDEFLNKRDQSLEEEMQAASKRGEDWQYVGNQHSGPGLEKRGKVWQYVGDQHNRKEDWKRANPVNIYRMLKKRYSGSERLSARGEHAVV